jgi:hypothetical protein
LLRDPGSLENALPIRAPITDNLRFSDEAPPPWVIVDMNVALVAVDADRAIEVVPSWIAGGDESGSVAVDWERDSDEGAVRVIRIDSIRLSGLAFDTIWAGDEERCLCSGK